MADSSAVSSKSDIFGKSQFRGRGNDFSVQAHRWLVQFVTLLLKNCLILYRRPLQLLLFVLLPSTSMFLFLLEIHDTSGPVETPLYGSSPLTDLGKCDSYYSSSCVQVVYAPTSSFVDSVMRTFSANNGLEYGEDVQPFDTVLAAQEYVASHLGKVQFTVFFYNESLWATSGGPSEPKNMSYVVFYNSSQDTDERSGRYGVNFPMLVLQRTLDDAYMQIAYTPNYSAYEVNFGVLWRVPFAAVGNETADAMVDTPCDWETRHEMETISSALPWVLVFSFLLMSNIPFQMIAEEKRKKLFSSMRRLGLMDTAYWTSWFITFQILLVSGCCFASLVGLIVSTQSSALRAIDSGLFFLILWLSGTAFMSLAFFLGSFCSTSSVSAAVAFTQFLIALITISACTDSLNSYSDISTVDDFVNCNFLSSSYNRIYSESVPGNSFVEFLVFFLPWFHAAQAITDVLSIVQYKDQNFNMNDVYNTKTMSLLYNSEQTETYTSECMLWSCWCVIFLFTW